MADEAVEGGENAGQTQRTGPTRVVGYARVSTLKQLDRGHGIDVQIDAIKRYCKLHGYQLVQIYKDEGVSGAARRPAFQKAMERVLGDDSVSGIVVYDLSRFGRSTEDVLINLQQLQKAGKFFASIRENIDLSTSTGKLLLTMLAAIAEFERETILERMRAGLEWAKIHGTKSGKPMHRPPKKIDWKRVRELRKYGISWSKIAQIIGVSHNTLLRHAREKGVYEKW